MNEERWNSEREWKYTNDKCNTQANDVYVICTVLVEMIGTNVQNVKGY